MVGERLWKLLKSGAHKIIDPGGSHSTSMEWGNGNKSKGLFWWRRVLKRDEELGMASFCPIAFYDLTVQTLTIPLVLSQKCFKIVQITFFF